MSTMATHHQELTNGEGKCSVPMWRYPGVPAGFCDRSAYGEQEKPKFWYRDRDNNLLRSDGRYEGYAPGLACYHHSGPKEKVETLIESEVV